MVHAGENSESVSIASRLTPSLLCVCVRARSYFRLYLCISGQDVSVWLLFTWK